MNLRTIVFSLGLLLVGIQQVSGDVNIVRAVTNAGVHSATEVSSPLNTNGDSNTAGADVFISRLDSSSRMTSQFSNTGLFVDLEQTRSGEPGITSIGNMTVDFTVSVDTPYEAVELYFYFSTTNEATNVQGGLYDSSLPFIRPPGQPIPDPFSRYLYYFNSDAGPGLLVFNTVHGSSAGMLIANHPYTWHINAMITNPYTLLEADGGALGTGNVSLKFGPTIPEPSSVALLFLAGIFVLKLHRKSHYGLIV